MIYEEDHPLHGRDAEWIEKEATDLCNSEWEQIGTQGIAVFQHELKRLRAELAGVHPFGNHGTVGYAWLARAIELSGAYKGSDWEMLTAHIAALRTQHDTAVARFRRLEERAEAAEAKAEVLRKEKYNQREREYQAWVDNGRPSTLFDLFKEYEQIGTIVELKAAGAKVTTERARADKAEAELKTLLEALHEQRAQVGG